MNLKIAVCDDELLFRTRIANALTDNLNEQGIFDYQMELFQSGRELCELKEELRQFDALFLDISMPDKNGMQVAEYVRNIHPNIALVFITSYIDFAPAGYQLNAMRYILKDSLEQYLPEAVRAVLRKTELQKLEMAYDFLEGRQTISIAELYYIESSKHKLVFHLEKSEPCTIYGKLDEMEQQLAMYNFIRVHKSFLVNYKHINQIGNYKVYLSNGEELPIPRERFRQVKERYYELRGGLQ